MKITWNNTIAPQLPLIEGNKEVVIQSKEISVDSLVKDFRTLVNEVGEEYNKLPLGRYYVRTLQINCPDISEFYAKMDQLDPIYRTMTQGGDFGQVALVEGEKLQLTLNIEVEPTSDKEVFNGLNAEELAKKYNTFLTAPDAADYSKLWAEKGNEAKDYLTKTVVYGSDNNLESMDLFLPENKGKKTPLLMFIHGGYWQWTDKSFMSGIGENMVKNGIATAIINYPHAPEATMVEMVQACEKAARHLYYHNEEYNLDTTKFNVSGHSAGGHLAGVMGVTKWNEVDANLPKGLFKNVFAFSGLYDLEPFTMINMNRALHITEEQLPLISIKHMNTSDVVADYNIFLGTLESSEFHYQARFMKGYVESKGAKAIIHDVKDKHHFSTINEIVSKEESEILDLITSTIKKS